MNADDDGRICRYDLDAAGKQCAEGYYATDGRTLYLMPPTGEMAPGLRLATADEVARGGHVPANAEQIANCDPSPSDRKA